MALAPDATPVVADVPECAEAAAVAVTPADTVCEEDVACVPGPVEAIAVEIEARDGECVALVMDATPVVADVPECAEAAAAPAWVVTPADTGLRGGRRVRAGASRGDRG